MSTVLLIEPPSPNPYGTLRILGSLGSHKADMAWAPLDLMIISGLLDKHLHRTPINWEHGYPSQVSQPILHKAHPEPLPRIHGLQRSVESLPRKGRRRSPR